MSVRETGRVRAAIAIVGLLLALVAVRLVYLTFVRGPALAGGADRQHRGVARLDAQRGSIFDRHGDPLAVTVTAGAVGLHPALLPADPPVTELCDVLGVTRAEWNRSATRDVSFTWLKRPVSAAQMEAVEALGVRGVRVEAARRRLYPRGRLAASLVGFAGVDLQGLEGVERVYDRNLRSGAQKIGVERDGRGRLRFTDGALPRARRGADVELTIDSALQFAAEQALDRQVSETGAAAGVAVMLDPHTGEILALAQSPGFDLNHYAEAPRGVRRNRAITDVYEPGSTLKAMLAAAVLETDDSMRDRTFYCENGHYRIGRSVVHDHHGYGDIAFDQVFGVSSNICAAKLGAWLGANRLDGFLRRFGFGAPTGIELDGEQPGIMRPGATWKPIELATISFGQGIAVTPLQMASAFAVIANGGNLVRPYVVRRILDVDGTVLQETVPTVVRAGVLRPGSCARHRAGAREGRAPRRDRRARRGGGNPRGREDRHGAEGRKRPLRPRADRILCGVLSGRCASRCPPGRDRRTEDLSVGRDGGCAGLRGDRRGLPRPAGSSPTSARRSRHSTRESRAVARFRASPRSGWLDRIEPT